MSVTSEDCHITYARGSSANDLKDPPYSLSFPFLFFDDTHLEVSVTDANGKTETLTLTTHYAVTGANAAAGGTVSSVHPVANDPWTDMATVTITRKPPATQPFSYRESGRLPMKTLEKSLDWQVMLYQWLKNRIDAINLNPFGWSVITGKPAAYPPEAHAASHATAGSDPLSPADIGAPSLAEAEQMAVRSDVLSPFFASELRRHQTVASTQTLTLLTIGDSMMQPSRFPGAIKRLIESDVPVVGYALEYLVPTTASGTITNPSENGGSTAEWDTGRIWSMAASAQLVIHDNNGTTHGILGSKATFWCIKQSGGGTATFEYSRDAGSTWLPLGSVDTNGTAGDVTSTATTPGNGLGYYLYRVTATGGPVKYLGAKIWDDTRSGVILAGTFMGGISVAQSLLAPAAVRNQIGADLGRSVLVYQFREANGELTQSILNNWLDAWRTALPNSEIILIDQLEAPLVTNGSEADTPLVNAYYRVASAARPYVKNYAINQVVGDSDYREQMGWHIGSTVGTFTADAGTNVITTSASHGLTVGTRVVLSTTGTLPAGLEAWTRSNVRNYFVSAPTANQMTLSLASGGDTVDITDTGNGTHTINETDPIHLNNEAWKHVGADFVRRLTNGSSGSVPGNLYTGPSGSREVIFGHAIAEIGGSIGWFFRLARLAKGFFGVVSKNANGAQTKFGFSWQQTTGGNLPDGVLLEFHNDSGYKTPFTLDGSGCWYLGPYNATTQSGYARGARVVVEEDYNAKACLILKHTSATATNLLKIQDSTGTDVVKADRLGKLTAKSLDVSGSVILGGLDGTPPATSTSTGVKGTIVRDGNYIYICIATDTWRRIELLNW